MRKTKKTLSLLLALAMVLTLFAGVAQASANVRITSTTAVLTPGSNKALGTVNIAFDPVIGIAPVATSTATVVMVTLPSGVTWDDYDIAAATTTPASTPGSFEWTRTLVDAQTAIFRVSSTVPLYGSLSIETRADIASDFRGDILATVAVRSEHLDATQIFWEQSETERLGRVAATGTISTAITTPVVPRGVANQLVGNIRIVEAIAGSLTDVPTEPVADRTITLTAPSGVTFQSIAAGATITAVGSSTATRILTVDVVGAQTLNITGIHLNIGTGVPDGPIFIQVSGANATVAFVPVATVGAVGVVSINPINVPADPITAGRLDRRVAGIRFSETMADAFLGNRALVLTLPEGFSWHGTATVGWELSRVVSSSGRVLTIWTIATPAGPNFDINEIDINASAAAPEGDIVVTVGGTAGPSGTVTVGRLRRPVTVTAVTVPNVRVDSLDQTIGSITITENFVGALRNGSLTVSIVDPLPGMALVGTPTVTVSDVTGTEPAVFGGTVSGTTVTFTVARPFLAATTPATITISGIRLNRTVGLLRGVPVTVEVAGTSVLETGPATEVGGVDADTGIAAITENAARGANIARVTAANVVSATARTTVFTVGQTVFTVDGVAQPPLDVAPFIQDGRTMMPIRAAANAAGVTNDRILFNAGVITIMGDNRIAQFTLGSRVMLVNNTVITMAVAPAQVANRALIPVRYVAAALGVPVAWDVTARTVTVSVQ